MSELKICKCCGTPIAEDEQQFNFMHDDFHVCINVFKQRIAMLESQLVAANKDAERLDNKMENLYHMVPDLLMDVENAHDEHESRIQEAQNG